MRSMMKTRRSAARPMSELPWLVGGLLGILTLGGCADLEPPVLFEPETDAAKLYGSLTLDHRAINLSTAAPHDTIQLTATPRNLRGEPLEGLPTPTFRSSDTASVWVTPEGLVQAREAASGVQVIAEVVTGDNVRHADTAYVSVTSNPTPPEVASLEIAFAAPEQAEWPMPPSVVLLAHQLLGITGVLPPPMVPARALDDEGNVLSGLEIDYLSLNTDVVVVDRRSGVVQTVVGPPGEVAVVARTTAYGVVVADTVTVTVTPPLYQELWMKEGADGAPSLEPRGVTIRVGGYVFWYNGLEGTTLDITFDGPANVEAMPELCAFFGGFMPALCESGDITDFVHAPVITEAFRVRAFPEPGIYEYEITAGGLKGHIRVVADDEPLLVNKERKE